MKKYKATIRLMGKDYTSRGETVSEALAGLVPAGKGPAVLTITVDDKERSRVLTPLQVMRLFSASKLMREIALKHTTMLFDI